MVAAAVAAVLGLIASACSSDGSDSSPAETTAAVVATTAASTPPETATTTTEADGNVVESQSLPAAPGTEQVEPVPSVAPSATSDSAEAAPSASSSGSAAPGTQTAAPTTTTTVAPSVSSETGTPETTRTPETTTLIEGEEIETPQSPQSLQIRVLNASGVPGAAGSLTDRLSGEGYVMLAPENAPRRYSSSAVYYARGWQEEAEQILEDTGIEELQQPTPVPSQFAEPDATVIVLLGTDTAPAPTAPASSLRPRQDNNTQLPLPASTPRDRYVPGLADINIYSQTNDQGTLEMQAKLEELSIYLRYIGNYQPYTGAVAANRDTAGTFRETAKLLEDTLLWLGFTPQNVCGAPSGYTFTDLLQPTREWSEELKVFAGDAIRTTDRLIELHGGPRINPEENLDFYIREAVQTTHDALRLPELLDETEAPQLILCRAWLAPSGEIPEFANGAWYALLTPGIQPRESLLSQGTYHMKHISRNGNRAFVYVCHPTLGTQGIRLHWREAGYRAEILDIKTRSGCQAAFEQYDNSGIPFQEPTTTFTFGEQSFAAADLQSFPR